MKSLFNKAENQEIINRINSLRADSQAKWGKMNVAQMLTHCQQPLRVVFGELKLKRGILSILFGNYFKKQMVTDERPFTRNLPTDKTFIITDKKELEEEKKKLIDLVKKFEQVGPEGLPKELHPFFGKLTSGEWDILQWKHLDHHLNQFGA